MNSYSYAMEEALGEGKSEEEAEEIAQKAESEERGEEYSKWHDAVVETADHVFGKVGIKLVPKSNARTPYEYKFVPQKSWKDSANEIREIINGVGYFHFDTLKEFLSSGPYTEREAVLYHLHHAMSYGEVYGDSSPKDIFDRNYR
jgi:hypothetical protein